MSLAGVQVGGNTRDRSVFYRGARYSLPSSTALPPPPPMSHVILCV